MAYDYADNPTNENRAHTNGVTAQNYNQRRVYDELARLHDYNVSIAGVENLAARYEYNYRNELITRDQHWGGSAWLQKIDYSYNDQSWLTSINQSALGNTGTVLAFPTCTTQVVTPPLPALGASDDSKDLFYMQLQYDALYTGVSGTLRKDGNISQAVWRVRGRERQAYSYTYDGLQRLSTASYSDISEVGTVTASNRYNTSYTYADLRGNFSNVQRNGQFLSGACYTQALLDNMTYSYNAGTNQISSISDAANATQGGYRAASGAFTYDVNGNIKTYAAKGISNITYNHLNLPTLIDFGGGKVIEFTYSSGGNKLKKVVKNTGGSILYTEDYVEGIEYKNGTVEAIYHKEGRLYNNAGTWQREYSIRDHLGNTRLTYADLNNDGVIATPSEILQENSYDPFGSPLDGVWMNHAFPDNQYQYNNKELNADHGLLWLDYGARFMDPGIGRFTTIDPLTDVMRRFSTYNYAFDNPIRFIDPDGRAPEDVGNPIRTIATFLAGFSNAIASNSTGNYPGTRGNPNDFGDYASAASYGQRAGDAASVIIGVLEMTTSAAGVTIEAILAPETGVSALAIAPTAALATEGVVTATSALKNLLNPTKVEAKTKNRTATEHTKDKRPSTEQDHQTNQARQAKEQKAADEAYSNTKSTKSKERKSNNQKKEEDPNYYRKGSKN